jgi:hypothetical protein
MKFNRSPFGLSSGSKTSTLEDAEDAEKSRRSRRVIATDERQMNTDKARKINFNIISIWNFNFNTFSSCPSCKSCPKFFMPPILSELFFDRIYKIYRMDRMKRVKRE